MFFFAGVGKWTSCSKPWSFMLSINIYPSDWLSAEPDLLSLSGQSISLKLKSPKTWTEGSFLPLCWRSVCVAERLALPTSDHRVVGSNPAGGEILPEPKRRFIALSLSCSPFHCLEMTEILLKGCKTLTHPSILCVNWFLIWSSWSLNSWKSSLVAPGCQYQLAT